MKCLHLAFALIGSFGLGGCSERMSDASRHGQLKAVRDYGYVIGDVLPMDYRFHLNGGEIDQTSLPPLGPVDEWLTIRSHQIEQHPDPEGVETILHVEYQIFKGIKQPETLTIPPIALRLRDNPLQRLTTDAWTLTQLPVIPPALTNEEIEPHEGVGIGTRDNRKISQHLAFWSIGLTTVAILMLLRRYLQRKRYRPFQSTQARIRSAFRESADPTLFMEGMRLMHRGLDHTFGQTLFRRDIPVFMAEHPQYRPAKGDLEFFFSVSTRLFFESSSFQPDSDSLKQLSSLLGHCLRAERGQV